MHGKSIKFASAIAKQKVLSTNEFLITNAKRYRVEKDVLTTRCLLSLLPA